MSGLCIIPECYVDTCFIETLVPNKGGYNHQKGCPAVGKVMQEKFKDKFAVGIIDKDKKVIKYLEEFNLEIETDSLLLLKHKEKHHYIIQIEPAAEKFILEAASSIGVDLCQYGLVNDLEGLKTYTKKQTSKNDPNLKNAFNAIKNASICKILSQWIGHLYEHQFATSMEELKKIAKDLTS